MEPFVGRNPDINTLYKKQIKCCKKMMNSKF